MPAAPTFSRRRVLQGFAATGLLGSTHRGFAQAAAGTPVVLGHTYPASGIFAEPAAQMKAAINAAVRTANERGGLAGRPVKVVSLDDGYDPQRSLANADTLVNQHGAVALICPLGVPTVGALMPWAEARQVPLIGARSGADGQRAYRRYTFFNVASFGDEVRYVARHLDTIGVRNVAVAAMDNPTGADIGGQFASVTGKHRLKTVIDLRFDASGNDAASVAKTVAAQQPKAVLIAGGGKGAIALVQELLKARVAPGSLYGISIIGTDQLLPAVGSAGNGMVITQVMPKLGDARFPIGDRYAKALAGVTDKPPTLIGLEAYLSVQIALAGLSRAGPLANGASLARALEALGPQDFGGFGMGYDSGSHHGTRYVDISLAMNGRLVR